MLRKLLVFTAGLTLTLGTYGCRVRSQTDSVSSGAQGPASPATSGQHGSDAFDKAPLYEDTENDQDHQTAGLMPEYNNGKTDPSMEGSGNLAWQGSYEREKRAAAQSQPQPAQMKPVARPQAPTTSTPAANPGTPPSAHRSL